MSLNYNHLYHFHIIANEGSLAGAARKLNLAQSTLSEQLKQLESYFEEKLFTRDSSGLKLNVPGKKMYRYTKLIFKTGNRLEHAFKSNDNEDKITLDVGVSSSISRSFAAEYFVSLFEEENILIRIKHGDYDYLLHNLMSSQIDILLGHQKPDVPKNKGLKSETVKRSELLFVAATASSKFINDFPKNLSKVPLINYSVNSSYRWEVDQYYRQKGEVQNLIGEVDDVLIIKAAVEQGVCCAVLPEKVVYNDIKKKRFTVLDKLKDGDFFNYVTYLEKDPEDHIVNAVAKLRGAISN